MGRPGRGGASGERGESKGGRLAWLQRLWRSRGTAAETDVAGRRSVLAVEDALADLESRVCEAVALPGGADEGHGISHGAAPVNAFGKALLSEVGNGAGSAVAVATGMTLAGLRSSVFLEGSELAGAHGPLESAASRMVPLLVHAAMGGAGHRSYHAVADSGCFQIFASSGQQALDLSLVARWVAERALCPGLVVTDAAALDRVQLPDPELIRSYLGAPEETMATVTDAQRILFGSERRRLLPWFDPDRPVAAGGPRSPGEGAWGRGAFFGEPLAELARQGMEELERLTGRPLSFLDEHGLEDAEVVLVGQGAAARCARALADELRRRRGPRVGVVGITWLRPLPARELARVLAGRRRVAVVEALEGGLGGAPLFREVAAAAGSGASWTSATCAPEGPAPAALAGLCELLRGSDPPQRVDLEAPAAGPLSDEFPRREALLQQVDSAFPELRGSGASAAGYTPWLPQESRSAGLVGLESELASDAYEQLARAVAFDGESCVRGCAASPLPGVFEARVRSAREAFSDPGLRTPVSALLVCGDALRALGEPLGALERGGLLLLSTARPPEQVGASLPASWRRAIAAGELRVHATGGSLQAALEVLRGCLDGRIEELAERHRLRVVEWRAAAGPAFAEQALPALVHRIPSARQAHDSLPRFWGEVLQPAQAGAESGLPDPLTASGVVPAGASALAPEARAPSLPRLDADACTGCGRCWTACPDSAIGATALGAEALFTAASRRAGCEGPAADALRRNHKHLAARLAKAASGRVDEASCREAWEWLAGRLDICETERPAYQAVFDETLEAVVGLEPVLSDPFYAEPEREKRGSGELLVLAFDPRSCLGCGLCVAACPEDALAMEPCADEDRQRYRTRWQCWEALPDTRGETVERSARYDALGPMAAVLLSRSSGLAQLGAGEGEPASGERLACRWFAALLERQGQRWADGLLRSLDEACIRLEESARLGLGATLAEADLTTLEEALSGVGRDHADLSALGERLDAMGSPASIDRGGVLRRMRLAAELKAMGERIARGEDGLGRARFGVLVSGGRAAHWAARVPRHPWYAPLTCEPGAAGAELARGLARGLVAEHVALIRALRRAELELASPADRAERLASIESLRWEDLDEEERAGCTPLLLLGDAELLAGEGFDSLARLLDSDLPVKILLLDGRGRLEAGLEPGLAALAHRRAFVLSTALSHPDHFAWGVADVLAWSGPALVHVHAPSPRRHGFAADATLERARLAVEGRAHLLLRYDPDAEGLFGLRLSLEGNPSAEEDWGAVSFAEWAAGEERFAACFEEAGQREKGQGEEGAPFLDEWLALSEQGRSGRLPVIELEGRRLVVGESLAAGCAERLALWRTLQELAGVCSPFTEPIRAGLSRERDAEDASRLAALEARHAAELAELRDVVEREGRERLVERLLVLSGFAGGRDAGGDPKGNGGER